MVLEGPQGARKSTACAILGGPWFSDNCRMSHPGRILAAPAGQMADRDRRVVGDEPGRGRNPESLHHPRHGALSPQLRRKEVIQPRQCLFVGTTNQAAYLRDETGGRRFWPVRVGVIDTDALARDRDQLFAEAVRLFRADGAGGRIARSSTRTSCRSRRPGATRTPGKT